MWTCFVIILNLISRKLMANRYKYIISFNNYISFSAQHISIKISTNMDHYSAYSLNWKHQISGELQFWFLMRPCFVGICIMLYRKILDKSSLHDITFTHSIYYSSQQNSINRSTNLAHHSENKIIWGLNISGEHQFQFWCVY